MSRIMATDDDGDRYVAEQTVGDATVRVLPGTIDKRRREDGTAYWEQATYEVCGPGGDVAGVIVRHANSTFDVPEKAQRVGLAQAVAIALGRQEPPAPRRDTDTRRAAAAADLEAALAASLAQAGPQVKPEPRENWELRQGDRIMRHLALYPEGADPATMSAGMHDMPTAKIRAHLRRLMKDDGPVVELEPGTYARRGVA
jgi:hypothetical protein